MKRALDSILDAYEQLKHAPPSDLPAIQHLAVEILEYIAAQKQVQQTCPSETCTSKTPDFSKKYKGGICNACYQKQLRLKRKKTKNGT